MNRLRWKMAASATLAAVAALLVVLTLSELALALVRQDLLAAPDLVKEIADYAARVAGPLAWHQSVDAPVAEAWVEAYSGPAAPRILAQPGPLSAGVLISTIAIFNTEAQSLAHASDRQVSPTENFGRVVEEALTDRIAVGHRQSDGTIVAAAPIIEQGGELLGFVAIEAATRAQSHGQILRQLFSAIPATAFSLLPIGLVVGTIFGLLTTRGLVRRIRNLGAAATAWSRGELTTRVNDASQDELGDLTRDLEHMAAELDRLIGTRQELAAVEARNHLARELHDTVKQQVFSISMFLGSVDSLFHDEPERAADKLAEARRLVNLINRELSSLILALRPVALENQGLAAALEQFTELWTKQTEISLDLRIRGRADLPLELEQCFFRVVQEALANVARHSAAKSTVVHLDLEEIENSHCTLLEAHLKIEDDGQGFDPEATSGLGFGLSSMAERVSRLGGDFEVMSQPGQGTVIEAHWCRELAK